MNEDVLPYISTHPHSRRFKKGIHHIEFSCGVSGTGWKRDFKWLHFGEEVENSESYEIERYKNQSYLKINLPTAKSAGAYQCEVAFKREYCGDPVVLWSQSKLVNMIDIYEKEREISSLIEKIAKGETALPYMPSASAIANNQAAAEKFSETYTQYSETTAAFCPAFMETREAAADWREMRGFAAELIDADWEAKPKDEGTTEEAAMQPIVRSVLCRAVDMEIRHTSLTGFKKLTSVGYNRSKVTSDAPGEVIYHDFNEQSLAIAIFESKLGGGSDSEKIRLLCYLHRFAENLKRGGYKLKIRLQAFPCFLVGMHGKVIRLYGAFFMPISHRIEYVLLATAEFVPGELDECAKLLSKLKKGFKELKKCWSQGTQPMRFDEEKGQPLPCDCVAKQLYGSSEFRFTGHLKRSVFTGQANGEDVILKLAASPYGLEAHQCCEKVQVAPQIRKFKQFDFSGSGFCGVVMERLSKDFIPLSDAFFHPWMNADTATRIKEGIETALDAMHGKDLVHGDF